MEINYDKLWDELIEEGKAEQLYHTKLPNEKSLTEFMQETGLTIRVAKRILDAHVREGTLKVRCAILEGHKTTLYSLK